jgi:hypothetical protein
MAAAPVASIDRSVISANDTLTFTIRLNEGSSFRGPDLAPLNQSFHVLGNSQSSRHMIRNGRSESWTEWVITLMPKREGRLTIPAISIDGQKTQAILINVQASVPGSLDNLQPIFLESEVDKTSVYTQQQVIYTVRIFQSIQLDNMNVTEPSLDNAAIEKLGQNSFQRRIKNTPYRVHELRYAIFPQENGELIIPELVFSGNEAVARRSAFSLPGQGRPIRKTTQQHMISVKSPPKTFLGSTWLPAESVKLVETWSSNPGNIHVGDSITRTITTSAQGLLDSQLPPYQFTSVNGAKFYPDQGNTNKTATEQGVSSSREDSAAIIPTQAGNIELPEIRLSWWNTAEQETQYAVIPASSLTVKPALINNQGNSTPLAVDHSQSATNITAPVVITNNDHSVWQLITAFFAFAWLITLVMWWQLKTKIAPNELTRPIKSDTNLSEKQAFAALTKVCRNNDMANARSALINWGKSYWPEYEIQSFKDIQQQSHHTSLNNALSQLDNALYGNTDKNDWNGESILAVIKLVRENNKKKSNKPQDLPPLYSN